MFDEISKVMHLNEMLTSATRVCVFSYYCDQTQEMYVEVHLITTNGGTHSREVIDFTDVGMIDSSTWGAEGEDPEESYLLRALVNTVRSLVKVKGSNKRMFKISVMEEFQDEAMRLQEMSNAAPLSEEDARRLIYGNRL